MAAPAVAAPGAKEVPPPSAASPAADKGTKTPTFDFAADLKEHGAGACAAQVDALAAGTMGSVQSFNTMSNWSTTGGGDRLVSVAIGQKYAASTNVPYGVTSVVAAPNRQGNCDVMAVQVVPSPLSCAKLRATMSSSARQAGDLGGVPVMQDAAGQTMLVPTGADTCVLVALKTAYAN